jgi:hypothetical protein
LGSTILDAHIEFQIADSPPPLHQNQKKNRSGGVSENYIYNNGVRTCCAYRTRTNNVTTIQGAYDKPASIDRDSARANVHPRVQERVYPKAPGKSNNRKESYFVPLNHICSKLQDWHPTSSGNVDHTNDLQVRWGDPSMHSDLPATIC